MHRGLSLVIRVGVLLGGLSDRLEQSWIPHPRFLPALADEFDPELPVITVVEKESHLGAYRWEGVDDAGTLHAAGTALPHVGEQLIFDGRIEDMSRQFAVKAKCMIKIKAEDPNDGSGQVIEILRTQYLEIPINLRTS